MKNQARIIQIKRISICLALITLLSLVGSSFVYAYNNPSLVIPSGNSPQTSSTGIQGTIPSPAPTTAATIVTPSNNQVFTTEPITVTGVCPSDLLIEVFDNNVFSGSAQCTNSSYSITTYLFTGTNTLVAKDYDALNQEGPDSNTITATYNSPAGEGQLGITLTSNYAKLGQDPGSVLSWPIIISNGTAPYAVDVSWGDNTPDSLISQPISGVFNITHTYKVAGVYTILVRATDTGGNTAYLQLVAVANGKINQSTLSSASTPGSTKKNGVTLKDSTIWILAIIVFLMGPIAFWLGLRHQLRVVKKKLEQGERPFK